jgi:hypothetical protein
MRIDLPGLFAAFVIVRGGAPLPVAFLACLVLISAALRFVRQFPIQSGYFAAGV